MNKLISFDYAIKYLLKDKSNYGIVEGFISALLKTQGYQPIKIVALLDTESNKETFSQKKSLADLIVEDTNHQKYIIEIERQEVTNFVHKSCFNTARTIVDQIPSGKNYLSIKKVFHISLLYFKLGDGITPIYHGKTVIKDIKSKKKLSVHIENKQDHTIYDATDIFPEYIFISIPCFQDKVKSEIDEWLYVMKHEVVKPEFKSPCMHLVEEKLSILQMTTERRDEYFHYIKELATYKDAMQLAHEKGEKGGIEMGIQEGMKTGKQEGMKSKELAIAKKMLQNGLDLKFIQTFVGLSIEELENL